MSQHVPTLSQTFAAADVFVDNGIVGATASSASPVTVLPVSMTGAAMVSGTGRFAKLPRSVAITRASSAGSYTVAPIVITGMRGSKTIVESLTPLSTDGNDVLRSVNIFDSLISIAYPAQTNTSGSFKAGAQDIGVPQPGDRFWGVELAAAGTLHVRYGDGVDAPSDAIPVAAATVGIVRRMAATRVLTDQTLVSPTSVGLTVYIA
jgi:hypothetical protein